MTSKSTIPIKNIYYMLSYAFTSLNRQYDEEIAGEEFENIHNLFAAILAKGISHQLKQGLYREYAPMGEEVSTVHGKINLPDTIRNRLAHKNKISCEYDEFSQNNLYNQIIKITVLLLIQSNNVEVKYRDVLSKEMQYFANIDTISPKSINWSALRFHRNNQTYRMLLGISQMVLEGMLLSTDDGNYKLASFVDEQRMCRLYEKFILEYYRKEVPEITAESSQIKWALDDNHHALLPVMQSDIMLFYGGKVLIVDAKYYSHTLQSHFDTYSVHSANFYQIFAYVKNKQADPAFCNEDVAGMLLYARTDESIQPDETYKTSGNTIYVKTLDLNQDFSCIALQLNKIVEDHFCLKMK